jgi:hypothetical protein
VAVKHLRAYQLADGGVELVGVPLVARAQDRVDEVVGPVFAVRLWFALGLTIVTIAIALVALPQPDGLLLSCSLVSR